MLLPSGTLRIDGRAAAANTIHVGIQTDADSSTLSVDLNGQTQTFEASQVSRMRITGGRGDDSITLDGEVGQPAKVRGQAGNDMIVGGAGDDTLWGGKGDDRLNGATGEDRLEGGRGRDVLVGDSAADTLDGQAGADHIRWKGAVGVTLAAEAQDRQTASPGSSSSTVSVTEQDAQRTIQVPLGGQLVVQLASTIDPATGWGWAVTQLDQTRLLQHGDPVYTPEPAPLGQYGTPAAGGGGTEVFTFDAIQAGQTRLRLGYRVPGGQELWAFTRTIEVA